MFRGAAGGGCVTYFLDGRPLSWYGLRPEELYVFDVAGIEVLGPGEAPIEYQRGMKDATVRRPYPHSFHRGERRWTPLPPSEW